MVQDGPKKRPTLEPDPDASRVVKRIFDMAEAGTGMLHIARALNDEGIASPAGKLWSKNGIHFILRNEVYTGTFWESRDSIPATMMSGFSITFLTSPQMRPSRRSARIIVCSRHPVRKCCTP